MITENYVDDEMIDVMALEYFLIIDPCKLPISPFTNYTSKIYSFGIVQDFRCRCPPLFFRTIPSSLTIKMKIIYSAKLRYLL